jgi:hypothetical protein
MYKVINQMSCLQSIYNKPFVVSLTDAVEIMNRKITINNISIDCLQMQIKYATNDRAIQLLFAKKAQKKIDLIHNLNTVLSKQLAEFDEIRQEESNEIYKDLNDIDEPDEEIYKLIQENKKIAENVESLMLKINSIEKTIPDNKMMTNFKVKFKSGVKNIDPDII